MLLGFEDAKASMPDATYNLFQYLANNKDLSRWTLVGGTALSLYLKHRTSEDLDFFIEESEFTRGSLKEIEELSTYFEQSGIPIILTDKNDRLFDYLIGGVKVTFFASGLKSLKDNAQTIGSIDIASVNQIAAMKMESIIKYRTVTRDFFDVYTLWHQSGMDLCTLIDIYRDKYLSKVSVDLFETRFFDKEMDIDDPGYGSLQIKRKILPEDIRKEFLDWFNQKTIEENGTLQCAEKVNIELCNEIFGLGRQSLLQKLCSVNRHDLVMKYLDAVVCDLSYEDFSGSNLIDYYVSDRKMQKAVAKFLCDIPQHWLGTNRYMFDTETLDMLKYENTVIIQAKEKSSYEKIERIASKKLYFLGKFSQDVSDKAVLLKKQINRNEN
jgi:hypothetical protein